MAKEAKPVHISTLIEKAGKGMTHERFEEIRKADRDGEPLEVSDEERAEYEELLAMTLETMERFNAAFSGPYRSMMQRLGTIVAPTRSDRPASKLSGYEALPAHRLRPAAAESNRPRAENRSTYSGISQETLDGIAEVKQQELEREERNSENIEVTAQVMRDMLATMHAQAATAEERDQEAKKAATKNYRVAFGSLIFAALALIAPFVIEAIKGWD